MAASIVGTGIKLPQSLQECKVSWRCPPAQRTPRLILRDRHTCRQPQSISLRRSFSCPAPVRAAPLSSHTLQQPGAPLILVSPEAASATSTSAAFPPPVLRVEAPAASVRQDPHTLQQHRHILPDGAQLEVLEIGPCNGTVERSQPPLLFLHGASHGAWCWEENFLPWFAQHGHHCYAVSLRGSGTSSDQSQNCPDTYAQSTTDLAHLIQSLPHPPVLVAHSMGGFFAQRYLVELAEKKQVPPVSGVVMMASASLTACVPNMKWWQAQQSSMHAMKVIWWMLTSSVLKNPSADKDMLFSKDLPDSDFTRYHTKLRAGRQTVPASFKELQDFLPKVEAMRHAAKKLPVPIAVTIAGSDNLILPFQVEATAEYFGVEPILLPGLAHDLMLDTRWEVAAEALDTWLKDMQTP